MNIESFIVTKDDCRVPLVGNIEKLLGIDNKLAENVYTYSLQRHIDQLKDSISIFVEFPYVDKVYRDSYYKYFSSKLGEYSRDCIRLSFFDGEIDDQDFKNKNKQKVLQSNFRGFMVLRPTIRNIIGRSIISPKALKSNHFISCSAKFPTTVNYVKFEIEGFPHSSQDTETISCAETTLWAVMEYFGYKYAEYKPVLPSKIIEVLRGVSTERQIPSRGLNINQITYALRELGFGTRLYSLAQFGQDEFTRLFSCYVESGIPLIVAIDNFKEGGSNGHAILCIGHNEVIPDLVDHLSVSMKNGKEIVIGEKAEQIFFYDNDDVIKKFVFVDDNMPVYQQLLFQNPAGGYLDSSMRTCKISHFIAPLYPKIYLEAFEAKNFCISFLLNYFEIPDDFELYLRFFLTSSRSFKDSLNYNDSFDSEIKQLILERPMPKFLWIGEISNKELIKQKEATGLILIDATEANTSYLKPLILGVFLNRLVSIDSDTKILNEKIISLQKFRIFTNNLK